MYEKIISFSYIFLFTENMIFNSIGSLYQKEKKIISFSYFEKITTKITISTKI